MKGNKRSRKRERKKIEMMAGFQRITFGREYRDPIFAGARIRQVDGYPVSDKGHLVLCPGLMAEGGWDIVHKKSGYTVIHSPVFKRARNLALALEHLPWSQVDVWGKGLTMQQEEVIVGIIDREEKSDDTDVQSQSQ